MEQQPAKNPPEQVPVTPETPPAETPVLESRIPVDPTAAGPRKLGTADFAMLSKLPTRKPETFDSDAITRAAWMVGGLAIGLWAISLFAKPKAEEVMPTPPPAAVQEAAPIVLPGNDTAAPAPGAISLTPEPVAMPANPALNLQAPVSQPAQPVQQAPAAPAQPYVEEPPPTDTYDPIRETAPETVPAPADTPDPSNLFPTDSR